MAKYTTENIHTVALVGHGGAGKTTLAESLLWKTGMIGAMGSTERGSTVADSDPLEKTYGHSLSSAVVNFPYKGIPCRRLPGCARGALRDRHSRRRSC